MIPNLIDTHFHLDFYKEHHEIYNKINRLKQYTLCMTNSPSIYLSCKQIYPETKYLKFALGFHPRDEQLGEREFNIFMQLINHTKYVGEIGLDFNNASKLIKEKQYAYFERIVSVCTKGNKLMSVHLRNSEDEAICILKKYKPSKCIIHWFNGSETQLRSLVHLGCYFSINSSMVENNRYNDKLLIIPESRILIESDGPFSKVKKRRYSVELLNDIYCSIADYYENPNLRHLVYSNFRRILLS